MLIPSITGQARRSLDLCIEAEVHPDEGKAERQRTRQEVEETIRRALGADLPDGVDILGDLFSVHQAADQAAPGLPSPRGSALAVAVLVTIEAPPAS